MLHAYFDDSGTHSRQRFVEPCDGRGFNLASRRACPSAIFFGVSRRFTERLY